MKTSLLLITMGAFCYSSAQQVSEKEMRSHLKNVEKSKEKGNVIWDLDTVYKAGIPYCIITEKSNGAFRGSDYSVKSLQGYELIYVKYGYYTKPSTAPSYNQYAPATTNVAYYTYYFTDTKNKAEVSAPSKVYKTVAEQNLISGDHINSDEEDKFISLNGMKFSEDQSNTASQPVGNGNTTIITNGNGTIVERNRSASIFIINGQVKQDNVIVGSVQMTQDAENGIIVKTLSVFLADGTKVAEGKCYGLSSHVWSLVTLKDNNRRQVSSTFNQDAIDVVKYLISAYYL